VVEDICSVVDLRYRRNKFLQLDNREIGARDETQSIREKRKKEKIGCSYLIPIKEIYGYRFLFSKERDLGSTRCPKLSGWHKGTMQP
jgi:hypothetical protein